MKSRMGAKGLWVRWNGSAVLTTAFASGLAIGAAHLAISLEIGVSLTCHRAFIRSIFLSLYPLGVSFMGFGAVLERRLGRRFPASAVTDAALRAAGGALLIFLALALRLNFFVTSLPRLALAGVLHFAALAGWFLCLGTAVASLLREARRSEAAGSIGFAWAVHLGGLLAGYAASDFLAHAVGPNAVLFAVGAALAGTARGAPVALAFLLAAAPAVSLDGRIEGLRDVGALLRGEVQTFVDSPSQAFEDTLIGFRREAREVLFRGWSRFGLVEIRRMAEGKVRGFYNYVPQWELEPPVAGEPPVDVRWRRALYGALQPTQRILLLAAGGGRGLSCLPFPPHKGVTAVELNEAVVRFLRDESPQTNGGNYVKAAVLSADARFAVDTASEPFDAILVETGRFQTANMLEPAGNAMGLYTREGVGRYLAKLRPGGLLLLIFDGIEGKPWLEYLPLQVIETLKETGAPFRVLAATDGTADYVAIAASTDLGLLEGLTRRAAQPGPGLRPIPWQPQTQQAAMHRRRLTDDRPFAGWHRLPNRLRRRLLRAAAALAAAAVLAALWIGGARLRPKPSFPAGPVPFFFLIGAGQVMMFFGAAYAYRSFFGDAVVTAIRLMIYLLAYGALGSLASASLLAGGRRRAAGIALLGLHAAGLALIPFEVASAAAREAWAALALLPGGLFMGALFPAGVTASLEKDFGLCLLADSLGAAAGYALFHLVLLPWGIGAFLAAAFVLYAAALAVFPAGASR